LAGTYNVFANYRLAFWDRNLQKDYTFAISECMLSEKDDVKSPILRVQMGHLKFFAYRNRTMMINEELVQAIFDAKVHKI
jgi:hypothetical protein